VRAISDKQALALKAATRRAVDMAGGSESFQYVTRVGQGQLSKYGLTGEDHQSSFMPIDIALEADLEAGSPVIIEKLAALMGYRLVRDDTAQEAKSLALADVARLSARVGAFAETAVDALDDGHVSAGEERDLLRELNKIRTQLTAIETKFGGRV